MSPLRGFVERLETISIKMLPRWGFAIHSKVEQTLEKPAFTQCREFLHDSPLAGRPLEKPDGARMTSTRRRRFPCHLFGKI